MARQKITTGRVKDFNFPDDDKIKQAFLWDSEVPGLGIRATKTAKVYIFQTRLNSASIRLKIGDVRTWAIDGARQEARRLQAMIDQGIDPRIKKQEVIEEQETKRKEATRKELTFGDVWSVYLESRKNKWGDRHYHDHIALSNPGGKERMRGKGKIKAGPLASLRNLKLSELTQECVRTWAEKEGQERGARARLAFSLLRAFINWCNDQPEYNGLISLDACSNRIKKDALPRQHAKTDCLQKEQLPAWFKAVREYYLSTVSAYLQTLLLTGARRGELSRLKWKDVDFRWESLTIRDKVDGLRTIPLTPYVHSLLSNLPKRNQYVFSSPSSESGHIQEPRIPHNKCLLIANIEGLTLHGLRRSFSTLSEWVEVPQGIVAQIMGHKPSATAEKHYKRRPLDLLRMWHIKIEKWILEQAGIDQPEVGEGGLRAVK